MVVIMLWRVIGNRLKDIILNINFIHKCPFVVLLFACFFAFTFFCCKFLPEISTCSSTVLGAEVPKQTWAFKWCILDWFFSLRHNDNTIISLWIVFRTLSAIKSCCFPWRYCPKSRCVYAYRTRARWPRDIV